MLAGRGELVVWGDTRDSDGIEALAASAQRAYAARDLRGALRDLDSIVAASSANLHSDTEAMDALAVWYERRAQVRLDLKQFRESIADFDNAERMHSYTSLGLLTNRGLAHEGLSEWAAADADYSRAITLSKELGGELPYVLNSRANCRASLGKFDAAYEDYQSSAGVFQKMRNLSGVIYAVRQFLTHHRYHLRRFGRSYR